MGGISAIRYSDFLDGFPAALYRSTLEGTILYCNRAFAALFGYTSMHELIGSPEVDLYRNKKDRGHLLERLLHQDRLVDLPIDFQRRDGTVFSCAATVRAVSDDEGMVVHVDGLLRDGAGGVRPVPPAAAMPDERLQGVLELAGGVVHHLNQPLTILNNLLNELLVDLPINPPGFDKLVRIQKQLSRVIEITRKIASIQTYESVEYVAGVRIVDIEKASRRVPEKSPHD